MSLSGDPALQAGSFVAHEFWPTEQLPIEADTLEPEVQPSEVGEAHPPVHLGGGARDEAADAVVLSTGRVPCDSLAHQLEGKVAQLLNAPLAGVAPAPAI